MQCDFFPRHFCTSCNHCESPYQQQLQRKDQLLQQKFAPFRPLNWLSPVGSEERHYRNKAKMVVLGAAHAPILGIENPADGNRLPVSLTQCPAYPEDMQKLLAYLESWIRIAGISPYNRHKKKGELKFILLTRSLAAGEFMLRFVMRSTTAMERIERNLPLLMAQFPQIRVVSVNIQPVHMARLEGEEEHFLTGQQYLQECFNQVPLMIRPKSFFQTNPKVAEQLYATARCWVREIKPGHMWDLFCGVGDFALHCVSPDTSVTGIEIEPEAIASARRSAQMMGIDNLDFAALDSAQFSASQAKAPDLVLVNPPRRGLGEALAVSLAEFSPPHILYSSCNPETLLSDLCHFPHYQVEKVQWFDMFPHTDHMEVMVLLSKTEH